MKKAGILSDPASEKIGTIPSRLRSPNARLDWRTSLYLAVSSRNGRRVSSKFNLTSLSLKAQSI
jgi:hypothetical protein